MLLSSFVVDTCYVLSFAIIMLNTSLHNPSVKDKPAVERFILMNRGINDGGDLPADLLVVCTTSILLLFYTSVQHFTFLSLIITRKIYNDLFSYDIVLQTVLLVLYSHN